MASKKGNKGKMVDSIDDEVLFNQSPFHLIPRFLYNKRQLQSGEIK